MMPTEFRWTAGIECSFIPHLGIDQYRWTQHDLFWRSDFELVARDLGCRWLRYALPWHEIEREPGTFDWSWFDERLAFAESLGLIFLLDLVHFGTPVWLPDAFADADFPFALERFARAFGERYAGRVRCVCPINEPLITALFCGDVGLWPPYGKGLRTYMTVLSRVAQGFCRATRALRQTMPGVQILISDALEVAVTGEDSDEMSSPFLKESLRDDVARRMHRRHIVTDLILGRVGARHPLAGWLERHGFPEFDLQWFRRNAQTLDIIGLDYYEHTEVEIYTTPEGYYRQRSLQPPHGLYRAAQDYWTRYRVPLMVTETSAGGSDADKRAWLEKSVADVRRLRAEGFPVIGYTWWPVLDHLDWDGALLHQTGHIHPVGIYRLERQSGGRLERVPTALRDAYRELIARGDEAAGPLIETEAQRDDREAQAASRAIRPASLSYPIVAHGAVPWNNLRHRCHHVFSLLSGRHRILYVEPPQWIEAGGHSRAGLSFHPDFPNLCSLSIRGNGGTEYRQLLAEALSNPHLAGHFDHPVHWYANSAAASIYHGQFAARAIVYDCLETPPDDRLLEQADCIFTATHHAQEAVAGRRPDAQYLPAGVDLRHFARARGSRAAVPNDINFVPRPVLGYFGAIDDRIDLSLVRELAEADPNWSIVMVGPVDLDAGRLPRLPNIFWIGYRPYGEMPDYARGFTICIAPFAAGESSGARGMRPSVLAEYILSGRPVVCTDLSEVRQDFSGLVTIAGSPDEFVAQCRQAAAQPDREALRQAARVVARCGWKKTVAAMETRVDAAVAMKH